MTIEGDYSLFAHLETVYLGCLARRSLIMRNVREVVEAARRQADPVLPGAPRPLAGPDRRRLGGARGRRDRRVHRRPGLLVGRPRVGTVPHGLIAAFGGDTVAAARAFADRFADEMNVTVLVDFENDSVRTAIEVADALGRPALGRAPRHLRAHGGPGALDRMGEFTPTGVNEVLVQLVRDALDEAGHERVQIVVSGGFDAEKIREFERSAPCRSTPTAWARRWCGRERLHRRRGTVEGRPAAKVGRRFNSNPRLERVD